MERILVQQRFNGGYSEDEKDGLPNSSFYIRAIDFRSNPSVAQILPKTTKESGSTVTDLVKFFEPVGTDMWSVGDTGKIYKRTSGATWSNPTSPTSSHGNGLGYFPLDDYLYIPTDSAIARYGPITPASPTLTQDYFSDGVVDLDQFLDATGSTYSVPTVISEAATARQTFSPQRDPQKDILVGVGAKGTSADWTLTVHDKANTVIATKTLTNANVTASADNTFTFATPWRPVIGAEYHFHLTVSNTTGTPTVTTATSADLETVKFKTHYGILVTDTAFHPAVAFGLYMCFGNERYLATFNGIPKEAGATVYNPHRIVLPSGWTMRDAKRVGEYLAMVAVRSNTVTNFDEGLIAFWDGSAANYNFYHHVPDGTITAAYSDGAILYYITTAGNIYAWFNGQVQKIKTIPKMTLQTYLEIFPGAMTAWRGLLMIGISGNSDSTVLEKGVYSWGRLNDKYPNALSYDAPMSTGTRTGTGTAIGAVGRIGQTLFMGWKDGATYGVDVITSSANPFISAAIETLISDGGMPHKRKHPRAVKVTHSALISGQSVQVGYKIDRATSYTLDTANSTVGDTETKFTLPENSEYKEIQAEALLVTSSSNQLKVTSIAILYDDLSEEELL